MKILLTGATGTLGSQVLFSLLEEKFSSIERIYLPVREKKSTSSEKRIFNMLQSDFAPKFIKNNLTEIRAKITTVSAKDILYPECFLFGAKITHFIHSAGFVNLSTLPEAKAEIFKENFDFTKSIFEAYSKLIDKFIYISTAFSVGNSGGLIPNDYLKTEPTAHRNHYEASKYASEKYLTQAGAVAGIPIQILRPSVLGGNIKDAPNYFISKYMVFYLFAKFFYNNASKDAIRISTNIATGLNIIPTDYAAHVIAKVIDTDIEQLNIVHSQETNMIRGISKILEVVGFTNFTFTDEQITVATGFTSKLEEFYYKTIGVHLHPYMTSKPNEWDTKLLESILPMPTYNLEDYLSGTIAFAKAKNFRNQQW